MSYSILHAADLHFGKSRNLQGYLERQCQAFDWIYDTARKHNIPTVILAGDLYEKLVVKDVERQALTDRILKYDKEGFTTIIISGNHDWMTEVFLSIWDLVMLQEKGKFHNTFVVTKQPEVLTANGVRFLCIPNRGYKKAYSTEELKSVFAEHGTDKTVAILHECLKGSVTDVNWVAPNGCSIVAKVPPLYVALGDIHKQQRMGQGQYYCGSPIQHDFGDKLPKGCLLVDLDDSDNPKLEESSHIKPFLTTSSLGDLNKDAFIRYVGSRTDLPLNVPDNVVQIEDAYDEQAVLDYTTVKKNDLTDGLVAFMANEGLDEEEQAWGLGEVEDIQKEGQ